MSGGEKVGGIVGYVQGGTSKCYNVGTVGGTATNAATGGIGGNISSTGKLINCYVLSTISVKQSGGTNTTTLHGTSTKACGLISGVGGTYTGRIVDCSTVTETNLKTYASTLGSTIFVDDGKIKNENGEWVDNLDEQGNIIYKNGGFPLLIWQLEASE